MPAPNAGPRKATVPCTECSTEVEVTLDKETGDYEGKCPCGWDVGRDYTRSRSARAQRIYQEEKKEEPKKKTSILDRI